MRLLRHTSRQAKVQVNAHVGPLFLTATGPWPLTFGAKFYISPEFAFWEWSNWSIAPSVTSGWPLTFLDLCDLYIRFCCFYTFGLLGNFIDFRWPIYLWPCPWPLTFGSKNSHFPRIFPPTAFSFAIPWKGQGKVQVNAEISEMKVHFSWPLQGLDLWCQILHFTIICLLGVK